MFGIIWFIIVGIIIYNVVKRRSNEVSDTERQSMPPVQRTMQQKQQANRMGNNMPPQNARQNRQQQTAQPSPQGSTMAYLEEKARQDEIEHAKEKQEETRRLYRNAGGLRAAERLYEGDGVPNGKRCVICDYCGAENLVPTASREQYSCYFCREALR
ncbi:MAG: hypothetical protein NC321_08940 [Clostridium sp.]|nr:hypothetical protein [Clostridium sp.]